MIRLIGRVRHNGQTYEPGETIENIKKNEAQRLVNLGVAFFIGKINLPPDEECQEVSTIKQDSTDEEHQEDSIDKQDSVDETVNYEEELDLIEYNDLKLVAKEVGLEFKGNISKKNLIKLIIEKRKADEVLAFTEVDE